MKYLMVLTLVVCLGLSGTANAAVSTEDKYIDREVLQQVASWLVQAVRNTEATMCNSIPHKRNSEIINSILGLPKNLNDVGR